MRCEEVNVALPEIDVARARRFVDELNAEMPFDARDQVRFELDVEAGALTIFECRPPWREDYGPDWTRLLEFPHLRPDPTDALDPGPPR